MNGGIWRAAGESRNLSLGGPTALSQDIKSENYPFFPVQDPEKSLISVIFSRFDSRLIALDNTPPLIFTARLRVAWR